MWIAYKYPQPLQKQTYLTTVQVEAFQITISEEQLAACSSANLEAAQHLVTITDVARAVSRKGVCGQF